MNNDLYQPFLMRIESARDEAPDVRTYRLKFADEAERAEFFKRYRVGMLPAPSIIVATSPAITMIATTIITFWADLAPGIGLLLAVVLKLDRHGLVELPEAPDHLLQLVLALAGHADGIALDPRLDLRELVPDQLDDLARQLV